LRRFLSPNGLAPQYLEIFCRRKENRWRLWGSGKAIGADTGPLIHAPDPDIQAGRSRILNNAGRTGFDSVDAGPDSPAAQSR
jgi:hypothetical protein